MTKQLTYPYIRAWGHVLGSFNYYIEREIEKATADHAPQDALYKKDDGTWAKFDDIASDYQKRQLLMEIEFMEGR